MEYHGIYKGIIIQNNDPTNAGRVKVFVPDANATLLKDWNENRDDDKKIVHLGENTNTSLTPDIIQRLKEMLPWARVSLPIFGMSTAGFYDNARNTSYIGNDSDTIGQLSNKSQQFFQQDKLRNENRTPPLSTGSAPRQLLNLAGLIMDSLSYPLKSCGDGLTDSIWKNTPESCVGGIAANLPKTYSNPPTDSYPNTITRNNDSPDIINQNNIANDKNTSITKIYVNVVNPDIFINDIKVDLKTTIFNNKCYTHSIVPNYKYAYEPPIFFEESSDVLAPENLSEIPISLVVNNIPLSNRFRNTSSPTKISYIADNLRIEFTKNNVQGITVQKNSNMTDISKVKSLAPFIPSKDVPSDASNAFTTILPRIASVFTMLSPGGGAAAAYNRPNTKLLPPEQRRESLLGGNNPISKENRNFGKKDRAENRRHSGSNQQSKPDTSGPYRPPDHSNNFKGIVSIPAPGAHVHVRFEQGNPNYPIIVDTFTDQDDYGNIFGVQPK